MAASHGVVWTWNVEKSHGLQEFMRKKQAIPRVADWFRTKLYSLIPFKLIRVSFLNPKPEIIPTRSMVDVQGPMDPMATHGTFRPGT
jgi:hypothetical protein